MTFTKQKSSTVSVGTKALGKWTVALVLATLTGCVGVSPIGYDSGFLEDSGSDGNNTENQNGEGSTAGQPAAARSIAEFNFEAQAGTSLEIKSAATGETLWDSSPSLGVLTVGHADLHAEEHQGSFDIDENIAYTCNLPLIQSSAAGPNNNWLVTGNYNDGNANCNGVQFTIEFKTTGGQLQFNVTTNNAAINYLQLNIASTSDEKIYGMGEQFPHDSLNLKGRNIPALSQEGGIGRGHVPISPAVNVASKGSGGSEDTTYYASPHYFTNKMQSVFLENTEYSTFDFRENNNIKIRLFSNKMTGRILEGDTPLELIEAYTVYTGRMPALPDWVNDGVIIALARDLDESMDIVTDLKNRGVEIAGIWNQTWSGTAETYIGEQVLWNWTKNPNRHPDWDNYVSQLEAMDIKTLCYINSMFRDPEEAGQEVTRNLYAEGKAAGYYVKKEDGSDYMLPITAFEVGLLDLTNEDARVWMKDIIKEEMIESGGCSGWMADFAEALPFDAVLSSGESAASYHNQYPVEWAKLNREAIEEAGLLGDIMIFNRSGFTQSPKYAISFWEGDQLTTWDKYDGMVSALRGLINGGLSGISINHSDTGGYTSLSYVGLGYSREEEQIRRWMEMNAFTAIFRTHEGNQPGENYQVYSNNKTKDHLVKFSKVFKALGFYREELNEEATGKGWPIVRHVMLEFPEDEVAYEVDDQFMLGSEIMVAPIKNKCWTWPWCPYNKTMYLPKGKWIHLWSGKEYGSTSKGKEITVKAPLGKPAVFYKKGSAVGAQFVSNLEDAGVL